MIRNEARYKLFETADAQAGYFTGQQAKEAGYSHAAQTYHLKQNHWRDEGWGIFRLRDYPLGNEEQYVQLSLWSRDRQGRPQAVVSHETALSLYELSDIMPAEVHLTVPKSFRKRIPKGVVLHKAELSKCDIQARHAFSVTAPLRTLLDVAEGSLSPEHLGKAVQDALAKGLVRRTKLLEAIAGASGEVKEHFAYVGFQ
jgi:predicted transcriptional regulator of viral defense system